MLFGRRTYEDLLGYWTTRPESNPFTDALVRTVPSTSSPGRSTPTSATPNSTLLAGEAVETVAALKEGGDEDLTILGSGELVRALHAAGLIDTYVVQIHPIALGSGTRLFGAADRLDLDSRARVPTTTGVLIAQYAAR